VKGKFSATVETEHSHRPLVTLLSARFYENIQRHPMPNLIVPDFVSTRLVATRRLVLTLVLALLIQVSNEYVLMIK
jgi:hypothetical protein